jgi:hypothetical protein
LICRIYCGETWTVEIKLGSSKQNVWKCDEDVVVELMSNLASESDDQTELAVNTFSAYVTIHTISEMGKT